MTLPSPADSVRRPQNPPAASALRALAAATDRLLATIDAMSPTDFTAPSLLPGWTRAHLLAHLALNSKGLTAALSGLEAGRSLPIYASVARRDADIAKLAAQGPAHIADRVAVGAALLATHLGGGPSPEDALESVGAAGSIAADLRNSASRAGLPTDAPRAGSAVAVDAPGPEDGVIPVFSLAAAEHGDSLARWAAAGTIERTPGGRVVSAGDIPFMRWREVEIHHADLDLGYGPSDWPAEFAAFLYAGAAFDRDGEADMTLSATDGQIFRLRAAPAAVGAAIDSGVADSGVADSGPEAAAPNTRAGSRAPAGDAGSDVPEIHGSSADLAWWLVGRGRGAGLRVTGGALPMLAPWSRRS